MANMGPRPKADNEQAARRLQTQPLAGVRYFPLRVGDTDAAAQWDFGAWHQPTMAIELGLANRDACSIVWGQYAWGFGVDLIAGPADTILSDDALTGAVDVTSHRVWAPLVGRSLGVDFQWNDFGTGEAPCPEALRLSSASGQLWVIAADWERTEGRFSIQLGVDDLMVIGTQRFVEALGLFDRQRGRPPITN